jgi:apolipoprotein N-acyltransferase
LGADGAITARYDKIHLVPFGEFIPWGFRWFVAMMNIPLGDFGRGATDQALLRLGGHAIAFNICYEDLFGDELARHVRAGANILINVSNIAWFGDSHAQEQHLQIARMRSLELARPTLRATNTGVTAAIDHRGRVLERLPGHQFGTLSTQVHAASGLTPFARWANGPAWILALILLAGGAALVRRS